MGRKSKRKHHPDPEDVAKADRKELNSLCTQLLEGQFKILKKKLTLSQTTAIHIMIDLEQVQNRISHINDVVVILVSRTACGIYSAVVSKTP